MDIGAFREFVTGTGRDTAASAICDAGRPLHVNVLARAVVQAWLQASAETRRYAPGERYVQGETILLHNRPATVKAVHPASNPAQGSFTVLTLALPDGTEKQMAAEVPDAPRAPREIVSKARVRAILGGEQGPAMRAALQEALDTDDRFAHFQDAQGDHWCLVKLLPEVRNEDLNDALALLPEQLQYGVLRSRPTEQLVQAIWDQDDDGSAAYALHAFALNVALQQRADARWMGNGWVRESAWLQLQERPTPVGPRQQNVVTLPEGIVPVAEEEPQEAAKIGTDQGKPALTVAEDLESWRCNRRLNATITLRSSHYYGNWLPLPPDMQRVFPPLDSYEVTFYHRFGGEEDYFAAWVDQSRRRILGSPQMYQAFYENGIYPGARLVISHRGGLWKYDVRTKPVQDEQRVRVRRVFLAAAGTLEYEEAEEPLRYQVDGDVFVAAARWEDLPALFRQAEAAGAGIFQLMYERCCRWWEEGGRKPLYVTAPQLFEAIHFEDQGRLTSKATIAWEMWQRLAFESVGEGRYRFRPEQGGRVQPLGLRRRRTRPAAPPPAIPQPPATVPVPDEGGCWPAIRALTGRDLRTLDRGQPFRVVQVDDKSVTIHVGSTGQPRPIRRMEIEEAWSELVKKGELSRSDIQAHYSGFNPAYVAAILAALPDVTYTTRPIRLRHEPSGKPPDEHDGPSGEAQIEPTPLDAYELPLLSVLIELGGGGRPAQDIFPRLEKRLALNEADRGRRKPGSDIRWKENAYFAFEKLVKKGEAEKPDYGVWRATGKGKKRLTDAGLLPSPPGPAIERTRSGQLVATELVPPGPLFEEHPSSADRPKPPEESPSPDAGQTGEPAQTVSPPPSEAEAADVGPEPPPAPAQPPPPRPESLRSVSKSLFSRHYLEHRLQDHPEWVADIAEPFAKMHALYAARRDVLTQLNEAQTEAEFIRPALEILGFAYIPQTATRRAGRVQRPDYTLFTGESTKTEAYTLQGDEPAFYARALAIADAKYWARPLSEVSRDDPRDLYKNTNPSFQMVNYLTGTGVDWGILTNGAIWRLYYRQASSTATEFYEVDLVRMLEAGDVEQFKYFWLFFRRKAFHKDSQGHNFLERVREGSATYARVIGDRLKELVFAEVFPLLAGGFVADGAVRGEDLTTDTGRQMVYEATLSLLYKLLFLLYAEARNLLPLDNPGYRTQSLTDKARNVAGRMDRQEPMGQTSTALYDHVLNLFQLIDRGDRGLSLPRYNGGLFHFDFSDPDDRAGHRANYFLTGHRLSDAVLAPALDRLARIEGEPIDYGFIGVRHLGGIYEGLLEHRLVIDDARAGQVHLETHKGERKATGSYYTPDYIVKYIVRHTVGPILEERAERFGELMEQISDLRRQLQDGRRSTDSIRTLRERLARVEHQARETLLDIKICDPAMGSGHFLVEAVDFLTDGLIEILNQYPDHNPVLAMLERIRQDIVANLEQQGITVDQARLDDTQLLQRVVMKRCIYGVDLNPMAVELAKVSLWLHSFTIGAPLSFLDHHLRCGNSLIGATAREAHENLSSEQPLFGGPFAGLLRAAEIMRGIGLLSDATFAEVEESERLFRRFDEAAKPYKRLLDIYVARHFGVQRADEFLRLYGPDAIQAGPDKVGEPYATVIREAHRLYEEKRFFHWDLEFPEVFIDLERATWKENPGFDVVVGNPPYQRIQGIQATDPRQAQYYEARFLSATGKYDIYVLFVERVSALVRSTGRVGMILPHKFTQAHFGRGIRSHLHQHRLLDRIYSFGTNQVFDDVTTYTCLLFLYRHKQGQWRYYEMPFVDSDAQRMEALLRSLKPEDVAVLTKNRYASEPWILGHGHDDVVIERIGAHALELTNLVEGIFQGVVTGLNDVFILEQSPEKTGSGLVTVFSPYLREKVEIERTILKPFAKGEDIFRFCHLTTNRLILYPCQVIDGKVILYPEQELQESFPRAYEYLLRVKNVLKRRGSDRMKYGAWYALWNPRNPERFASPKIIVPDICYHGQMTVSLDEELMHADTTYAIVPRPDIEYDIYHLLAILNSRLLWFFLTKIGAPLRGGYFRYKTNYLRRFPVRRIAFTTPAEERARLVEGGINDATEWVEHTESASVSSVPFSAFSDSALGRWLDERLSPVHIPDPELVRKHNADPLNEDWPLPEEGPVEQSDVVHDLLAHLAEQMIEMNKQKQAEIKGFLVWLERETGASVNDLTNKTKLRNYLGDYQKVEPHLTLDELLVILRKNRRRLKADPTARAFQERLEREYQASLDKLLPLRGRLAATDRLIDLIVYRLYGLTEEEVAVVEGTRP